MWRKVVAVVILISLAASVGYIIIQTTRGFAVLTAPPPGIPGPYYVAAEAKIYGPHVDLAAIKSKTNAEYASDYTYVQWGTDPFYRVYADNTLQEVYYGQMKDVMNQFSYRFAIETNFRNTFDSLKNTGALDPTSVSGDIHCFGNMPGVFVAYHSYHYMQFARTSYVNITSSKWYVAEAYAWYEYGSGGDFGSLDVFLNDTLCVSGNNVISVNSTGGVAGFYRWKLTDVSQFSGSEMDFSATLYFEDLLDIQKQMDSDTDLRVYNVTDSPGTGYVLKSLSPSSPVAGSTTTLKVRFDPPSANKMNITDSYPNTFTWGSVDVLLEKFKVGAGLEESSYVHVVPEADGSNMKFTVHYDEALDVLDELEGDEYVYLTYSLRVPDTAGEYTLPAAAMVYLIPTP